MKKVCLILFLFFFGCSKPTLTLIGKTYQINIKNLNVILIFHPDGRFSGKALNNYFGVYKIENDKIYLTLQGSSIKIGTHPQIEEENTYFKNLKEIQTFTLSKETLILKGEKFHYQFTPLNSDEMNIH